MTNSFAVAVATEGRLLKRSCEALLGIAAGLIADGELNDREIQFLSTWLAEHPELANSWPGEVVVKRVRAVLADGIIDGDERAYLQSTLVELIGGSFVDDGVAPNASIALPTDSDVLVQVPEATFCFTGQFLFGTRSACEAAIEKRGGRAAVIGKKLNYLVIGELASREWKYSSFGTKIEAAIKLKSEGVPLAIVTEAQWVRSL